MTMQKPTKIFLSLALCLMVTIITTPAPIVAIDLATIGAAYIVGLALQSAFSIGANLGQSSRGRGRYRSSYGRSYGNRRHYGKREAEQILDENQEQNEIETNLISDGFNLMKNSDPSDCFKRIICDVATGEKEYSIMAPLMNFVSDDEDQFVPTELKRFSFDLKMAKKIGAAGKNTELCQETFKCPFTGEEMLRMTLEGFQPGFEKTIQTNLESRTSNE